MGVTMMCWWGCGSCGQKVSNDHMGPCLVCGGRIRRIMPTETAIDGDWGVDITPSTPRLSPEDVVAKNAF